MGRHRDERSISPAGHPQAEEPMQARRQAHALSAWWQETGSEMAVWMEREGEWTRR